MFTLADLLTTLTTNGALKASRAKDMKTSLRYLAAALGQTSLETCSVDAVGREEVAWTATLETHFATLEKQGRTISAVTRRNTRNNIRVVFRLADACGLLAKPLPLHPVTKAKRTVFERQQRETSPYQTTYYLQTGPRRFGLPQAQWPPAIQAGWRDYQAKCGVRLRATSFRTHTKSMATYLGYLVNICGRTPTWEDLFDIATLSEFLRWHGERLQVDISVHARSVVILIAAIAVVIEHPDRRALADFRNALPTPTPLHNKDTHWVSLATLEAVAEACLREGRTPYVFRKKDSYPGVRRATQFQLGVILKLLVRIPLRQRNVRELRLGKNLYEDRAGHWQLHFSGSELKIGSRKGQANAYHIDLTEHYPDLLPVLEEWRREYRPRIPGATTSHHLFVTYRGNPFTQRSLHGELSSVVGLHTGQRFYPHLIRTIWATEYLEDKDTKGDYAGAAEMLGDTLGVVMKTYYHLDKKVQQAKASAFVRKKLHPQADRGSSASQ